MDDLDDDILQLLSRPSSANTSTKTSRKGRKKVTFSNALVQNLDREPNHGDGNSTILSELPNEDISKTESTTSSSSMNLHPPVSLCF